MSIDPKQVLAAAGPEKGISEPWIEAAVQAMEPFQREGVLLERIWPPGEVPPGWLSQIGGHPNLPPNSPWPRGSFEAVDDGLTGRGALDFLAQIHLPDLPDLPERALLPEQGMLYFFALSQAPMPLADYGENSWRVLYHPGDPSAFPRRPPPEDAGWIPEGHGGTPAALLHDPDEPSGNLFPRCPVRLTVTKTWDIPETISPLDDRVQGFKTLSTALGITPEATIEHVRRVLMLYAWQGRQPALLIRSTNDTPELPGYVEGALLLLHHVHNTMVDCLPGVRTAPSEITSAEADAPWNAALAIWFAKVAALSHELKERGRTALIGDSDRAKIRVIYDEAFALAQSGGHVLCRPRLDWMTTRLAAKTSLTTLLLDHPELAVTYKQQVAEAHPARDGSNIRHALHRMLGVGLSEQQRWFGSPFRVPNHLPSDAVLLLQLESDWFGPRFQWWDMGNITFWISRSDLSQRRFERARAEIEG